LDAQREEGVVHAPLMGEVAVGGDQITTDLAAGGSPSSANRRARVG
jgi:hypothetical protein